MLLLLGVSLPLFQEPLSPLGELLLTSGITLHVQIFVKSAVQHKGKQVEYRGQSVWFLWQKGSGVGEGRGVQGGPSGAPSLGLMSLPPQWELGLAQDPA